MRRKLEKKPPNRSTICTTPRFLMKKKGKVPSEKQRGEEQTASGSPTVVKQQKRPKKTKGQGLKKKNKTQKEGGTEKFKKTGSHSSGAKLKK